MARENTNDLFKVWAMDNIIYGPIDFATLRQWVAENRVLPETWVHSQCDNAWRQARQIATLRDALQTANGTADLPCAAGSAIAPEELRQFSVFSGLSNELIEQFIRFTELYQA